MCFIDVKITTWERYYFSDESLEEIKEKLNKDWKDFTRTMSEFDWVERIDEVSDIVSPEENNNYATVELYEDKYGPVLWSNSLK